MIQSLSQITPTPGTAGAATVDPNFRWGDGIYVENSGGTRAVNCQVYEHLVSWHLYDGARSAFFSDCATGNDVDLADRNLGALVSNAYPSGNIISVLIDGRHIHTVPPDDQTNETDACESDWSNMVLGQHRPNNIVVQSDCDTPNRFANISVGSGSGNVDLEVDAGGVALVNAETSGNHNIFKANSADLYSYSNGTYTKEGTYPANLTMSNNRLDKVILTLENSAAGASTVGCANTLSLPPASPALNCPGLVAVTTIASDTTLDGSAEFWPCDASNGAVTITIPSASSSNGLPNRTFRITKIDATANVCTVRMGGSDKLNGANTYSLSTQYQGIVFTNANGSANWYIIAKFP